MVAMGPFTYTNFLWFCSEKSDTSTTELQLASGKHRVQIQQIESDMVRHRDTGNPLMIILANGEDPDEMQHSAAFHQGLYCLLLQGQKYTKQSIN